MDNVAIVLPAIKRLVLWVSHWFFGSKNASSAAGRRPSMQNVFFSSPALFRGDGGRRSKKAQPAVALSEPA